MRRYEIGDEVEVVSWAGDWVRGVVVAADAGSYEGDEGGGPGIRVRARVGLESPEVVWRYLHEARHVSLLTLVAEAAQLPIPEAGNSSGEVPG